VAGAGRLRAKILGPTLAAGFYRRDVLVALGGFELGIGEQLADVAVALAIGELGRLHVCEPTSRLVLGENHTGSKSHGFAAGRAAERLFWRYVHKRGLALSLGFHAASVLAGSLSQAPHISALTSLLGRAAALCELGAAQRHEQRLAAAAEKLEESTKQRSVIRLPASGDKTMANAQVARRKAA
jgi:hypothetical protein